MLIEASEYNYRPISVPFPSAVSYNDLNPNNVRPDGDHVHTYLEIAHSVD